MKTTKLKLGSCLLVLGFMGVLSLLLLRFPAELLPKEALAIISPELFRYLMLFNPTLYLIGAVIVGTVLCQKVDLGAPTISALLEKQPWRETFVQQLKAGISGGTLAGVLLVLISLLFYAALPADFIALSEKFRPALLTRFLYGGITEELIMRFGLMTFVVWVLHAVTKRLSDTIYWIGIVVAALLFALGHLPIVFLLAGEPTPMLIGYILFANAAGGIIFGWLYWKKGLEAAIIAHMITHVVMLAGEPLQDLL